MDAMILDPGLPARSTVLVKPSAPATPLISCIMASRGAIDPAQHAIACFRRQSYPRRELVIACATPENALSRLVASAADIRVIDVPGASSVGALRNAAIAEARGSLLCVWDDDDLSHPRRLAWQVQALLAADARACLLSRIFLWWPDREWLAVSSSRMWENTLIAFADAMPPYPDMRRGGDTLLVATMRATMRLVAIDRPTGYCYVAHGANLWGEAHFTMLFDHATERYSGLDYHRAMLALAENLPMPAYAAGMR